ncbi:MAG: GNAT family N-acetyltransferase [Rhodoferax sp.]|nr:GNAT family N-acetyltransferase [Rhodoferax sp.]
MNQATPKLGAIELGTPSTAEEWRQVRQLFQEYADSVGVDLCFQNFAAELERLPGEYAAPMGAVLVAKQGHALAGCCALRPLVSADYSNAAEMKRLYVQPAFRGLGVGRLIVESVLEAARVAGYSCVLLDTLDDMEAARALYEELGFTEVPPFYFNPIPGAHYLKVDL